MKERTKTQKEKATLPQLHAATKVWISNLRFIEDELRFIGNLLQSYVFEPNTPNLFERLQDYQNRLETIHAQKAKLTEQVQVHENDISGVLECEGDPGCASYREKHRELHIEVLVFDSDYQKLKSEIFNYAGGILRKRRP